MGLLEIYKDEIQRLCEKTGVKELYSFGSVNTTKFSKDSDVDLMVDFETNDPIEYTDNYFDLKFELERLLKRPIDLLESKAIKNPFLKENIDKSKILIYGY
ncbi:MAG TPA: nucleotidyltransferase domain-containing protein [Cyclobacteriaceae bacterium]|nr:nucleotidyltransferase domain-containing protein [Cyclobacteriaceae bacterium]HRJ81954.1 nucleotidyltransferase domain-containing protein [Cyclobacteriaceae bacterium]